MHIFVSEKRGVPNLNMAEIIPYEPETDNTGVGTLFIESVNY